MVELMVASAEERKVGTGREISPDLGLRLAAIADSKGGTEIVLLEIGAIVSYTDHLLICTARNERMAKAIADEIRIRVKSESSMLPQGSGSDASSGWLVMDYLDCVVHIFTSEARERFQLDDLWREAPRVDLGDVVGPAAVADEA